MKTCITCQKDKEFSEFGIDNRKKDKLSCYCRECIREKSRRYREANREKKRESDRKWREANPEKVRKSKHRWKEANPEKVRKSKRKWKEANPEKNREYNRKWREANPERESERTRKWRRENTDKVNKKASKRRARKKQALHPDHDEQVELELRKLAKELEKKNGETYHVDHILPLSKGGFHHHVNMQLLPATVNSQKSDSLDWWHKGYANWTDIPSELIPHDLLERIPL